MNIGEKIKGVFLKNKNKDRDSDPRRNAAPMKNGRRERDKEVNPYLSARRTWNEHMGSVVASRQMWKFLGLLSLLIALAGVGGVIYIGSQSRFIPYVVEVDKFGQLLASGQANSTTVADPRIIHAMVSNFVINSRMVTPDTTLQRAAVLQVYAHLSPNDPAMQKMNEWLNGTPDSSPFLRAQKELVNIEISSVLKHTPTTWQVEWKETVRDRKGVMTNAPLNMRGLFTVYSANQGSSVTEEQLRKNPLGIFIQDFSWTKIVEHGAK